MADHFVSLKHSLISHWFYASFREIKSIELKISKRRRNKKNISEKFSLVWARFAFSGQNVIQPFLVFNDKARLRDVLSCDLSFSSAIMVAASNARMRKRERDAKKLRQQSLMQLLFWFTASKSFANCKVKAMPVFGVIYIKLYRLKRTLSTTPQKLGWFMQKMQLHWNNCLRYLCRFSVRTIL